MDIVNEEEVENKSDKKIMQEKMEDTKITRAEKARRQRTIIRNLLMVRDYKWNELLDEAAKIYREKYKKDKDGVDLKVLKGKIGSSLSLMEDEKEIRFDEVNNTCSLIKKEKKTKKKKEETKMVAEEKEVKKSKTNLPALEKTKEVKSISKKTISKAKNNKNGLQEEPIKVESVKVEQTKVEPDKVEKIKVEPIKVESVTEEQTKLESVEIEPLKIKEESMDKSKIEETIFDSTSIFTPKVLKKEIEETNLEIEKNRKDNSLKKKEVKEKNSNEISSKNTASISLKEKKKNENGLVKSETKVKKSESRSTENVLKNQKEDNLSPKTNYNNKTNREEKATPIFAETNLKNEFLKRLRSLGGEYFEYYSIYLLERYSMRNGRRLEGMKISGGEKDGGIDGELELTDKFGFKEKIYIQAKNWDPSKGDPEKWVVGETLLQQFIGAVMSRQVKEGRRGTRGIFMTTSHFTSNAKAILSDMNSDIIGYDGDDIFDAAKECMFGLCVLNGKLVLDENLLSGEKAFFNMSQNF